MTRQIIGRALGAMLGAMLFIGAAVAQEFVNFESGHTRPLALSPDGSRLFAVNTPDNRLAIYDVAVGGLTLVGEVEVGLEPVAVAARTNGEVWVVNHLSDSVSVVAIDGGDPSASRIVRTLHTCDEPRDIVFAGAGGGRAFVTAARRGQNCPVAANLTTAGTPRSVVQVFDATALGAALGGTPIANLALFGDTPRALAATADGSLVYAAVFHSGNQTTALLEPVVSANGGLPPMPVGATPNHPDTGLIVKRNPVNGRWEDEIARNWSAQVPFSLPDRDVFVIDALASPPQLAAGPSQVTGVGTIIFNMAVRPSNGTLFVTNTDARNHVRFEPRLSATQGVQGEIVHNNITTVAGGVATPRHLNPHIDYNCVPPCTPPQAERDASLAFPTDLVFSGDGSRVYVAGLGSAKVGIFDAGDLESGVVTRTLVPVGTGPSGVALDEVRDQLYVMNRIDHTISIVSGASTPGSAAETVVVPLRFDPSPPAAVDGRRFLYDALDTSGHGDQACASCHVFGDFDSLAWDLGDPFGATVPNPNPFRVGSGGPFHPLKGPMTTQSLRGMAGAGPMHWRGDRTGGATGGDPLDEDLAFKAFNPAFVGLLGRATELSAPEMQAFTDFILTVVYPPNPVRALDDVATAQQAAGLNTYLTKQADANVLTCNLCHQLPLGTDGQSSIEGETQEFKIAHLRNAYQKIGMFGVAGNQVRGFGFLHDGAVPTVKNFLGAAVFNLTNTEENNLEAFIHGFDTGLKPIVGQQVSVTSPGDATVDARVDLLIARADAGDCDLVASGRIAGETRGAVYVGSGLFQPDRNTDGTIGRTALLNLTGTAGQEITLTAVPVGSGTRIGVDRDRDGSFDRTELDCGSDPADPFDVPAPGCSGVTTTSTSSSTSTSTSTSTTTPPVCGNGVREGAEECDGSDLGGAVCPGGSAGGGFLQCTGACTIDFGNCPGASTSTTTSTVTSTSVPTTTSSSTSTSTSTTLPGTAVPIPTRVLKMKDASFAGFADARKFVFKSKTKDVAPANRVVPPAVGGEGDPTLHGASLVVYNSAGTGEAFGEALPAGDWIALGSPASPKGFKYKTNDPARSVVRVVVKRDLLKVKAKGAAWGYTLDEPTQGSIAVRFGLGSAAPWCADTPGAAGRDEQDSFTGVKDAPAPGACPPVP